MVCVMTGITAIAAPVLGAYTEAVIATAAAVEGFGTGAALTTAVGEGALVGMGALAGGSSTGIALATLAGPFGWLLVGCNENDHDIGGSGYTWDCWKPVIRDASARPSRGMALRCLAAHRNVQSVSLDWGELVVGNVFGERFRLTPVRVEGSMALHASMLL
ncbi:hypothetical protein B0T25DRAFT_597651 [Lasiosphaeria hispida]|uniref:Uncharacterized protein n=1 Tax=Lasiosphaeria hispida TaxID=260671 RepID=A0AAJ0HW37_9PEZI|nr:hypothetical protein B0T25DRAFT_597651 [Lasiosphaeria hispida]